MSLPFPEIDPILISFGPFAIRWYALAYVAGIMLGWWYVFKLNKKDIPVISTKQLDDLVIWVILGVILGGRIGYVLFYNAGYYLSNPLEIAQIWHGGMSFHGGMLGTIIATYLFCRKHKIIFWRLIDMMACAAPIGLGLGRVANFINAELYGRVTTAPWGIVFPGGGPEPRHPSQLYEAFSEGLLLFILLWALAWFTPIRRQPGIISGLFLIGYATARMTVELFREPDEQLGFILQDITMGQILSLPMLVLGIVIAYIAMNKRPISSV